MSDPIQQAFMRALLDTPGVTRKAVAHRVGVDPTQVSRWAHGDRNLRLGDALYLVERWGIQPLIEAGRVVGLDIQEAAPPADFEEVDTGEIRVELLAGLAGEAARLAGELAQPTKGPEARRALVERLRAVEELCRQAQRRLLQES